MNKKWLTLGAMAFGGATLFQNGCLGSFWQGLFNSGFPAENRVLNVALDVLQEELFG